ncbi:MAG: hypothetical protein P4L85_17390 [Paludisphaera borealis]|uniref:hypothetical protein n=1 Tax=Paludisphaera borealis TaxID=1387353 RepID=UPI0028518F5A|nr:hypothetical protein [Paludisphaera borealis]MDR3621130.1 hypothetical protein [Paludisphaera borealis]
MRPPRVRFTVGSLLFAVAVVAANCWALRHFFEALIFEVLIHGVGNGLYRIMPAGVGIIPLINVVLIGSMMTAARRFRSLRLGTETEHRPSWSSWVAYFSLHIVLLGWLVCLYMPGTVSNLELIDEAVRRAAEGWAIAIGEPGDAVPWIIFESALLGLLVSGPPLLLSSIGFLLARRCAATLPRRRFLAMIVLVELGFVGAGLAICLTPLPFADEMKVELDLQVVDEVSGLPIAMAFVCVADVFAYDPEASLKRDFTNADGRARLTESFLVEGERNAFQTMGVYSPWGRWLEVAAAGHRTRRISLTEVLGAIADPSRPGQGKISLSPGELPGEAFRDLAGIYLIDGHGFGGCSFLIGPDGRFAWEQSTCMDSYREYGYLKRRGEEIELAPIPHPGRDVHPMVTSNYRVVEWGRRVYLLSTEEHELRAFCREALRLNSRPHPGEAYGDYLRLDGTHGGFLRQPGDEEPQTGWPRLPLAIWAKYLADEMNPNNEEGSLRLALDALTPKVPRKG